MRTSKRFARTSGVSTAGLRMSPASPPVQHTSTLRTPSAAYFAVVPAPFEASSSGCACTWSRQRRSESGTHGKLVQQEDLFGSDAAHVDRTDVRPGEDGVARQL